MLSKNYNNYISDNRFLLSREMSRSIMTLSIFTFFIICLCPEISFATSLVDQVGTAKNLASNTIKPAVLTIGSIVCGGIALYKGSLAQVGIIGAIILFLSLIFSWIDGGMSIGNVIAN